MPLYDYRCPACGQVYEVTRPVSRASDPLLCTIDETPCERVLAETEEEVAAASDPGAWYRSGHTHDDWTGAHINPEGVGRWLEILTELRMQASPWMEQLRAAGFRGGDVLSAALSPAVGLYTYYDRVVDDEGRAIPLGGETSASEPYLRGYLAYVWETLGRVALDRIFGATPEKAGSGVSDAVEADARLTALFLLWQVPDRQDAEARPRSASIALDLVSCFAEPLGIQVADWDGRIVHIEAERVHLIPLSERASSLLGADDAGDAPGTLALLARPGTTTLDRLHAAMLLQARGGVAALRALISAEQERGPDFRRLTTALSGLYPRDSDEHRVLAAVLIELAA